MEEPTRRLGCSRTAVAVAALIAGAATGALAAPGPATAPLPLASVGRATPALPLRARLARVNEPDPERKTEPARFAARHAPEPIEGAPLTLLVLCAALWIAARNRRALEPV